MFPQNRDKGQFISSHVRLIFFYIYFFFERDRDRPPPSALGDLLLASSGSYGERRITRHHVRLFMRGLTLVHGTLRARILCNYHGGR